MSEVVTENPIKAAAKAAFPYSMPMLAGFFILGHSIRHLHEST